MKKYYVKLLLSVVMTGLVLSGCGKASPAERAREEAEASEEEDSDEEDSEDKEDELRDRDNGKDTFFAMDELSAETEQELSETESTSERPEDLLNRITDEEIKGAVEKVMNYDQEFRETGLVKKIEIDVDKVKDYSQLRELKDLQKVIAKADVTFDVAWVEYCSQITDLQLTCNSLSDLSPLQQLRQLKHLKVSCAGLENVDDLTGMDALTDVYIECGSVKDISAIETMGQLQYFVLEAPGSSLYPGNDWSALDEIRVLAIDCELLTDYNFIYSIPVDPVYTASVEEQQLRSDMKATYRDYRANNYRSNYDFDKLGDEICLAHYVLKEKSDANNTNSDRVVAGRLKDETADNLLGDFLGAAPASGWAPIMAESAVAAEKNYEALGRMGFHIERYEKKWDEMNYHFIIPGNDVVEGNILSNLIEMSNPIPEVKTAAEQESQINTHIPDKWSEGKLWCDGITYALDGSVIDMINDSYEYRIAGKTVDIDAALSHYMVSNKEKTVLQGYADGQLIVCLNIDGNDVPLKDATVNKLTLFRVKGHETNLPQKEEKVHTMSLDFFTSDCATGFTYEGGVNLCRFQDRYVHVWINDIEMIDDPCDYCDDGGYASTADSVTISKGTIMGKYWE